MNMQELMYKIKKPFRIINALVNSAQTPEEFLIKGEAPPSILKVRNFLTKHDLRQIIKLQLFNNKANLFAHDGFHGFILSTKITNNDIEILKSLLNLGYPEHSTMSILLQHDANGACYYYITVTSKIPKKNTEVRTQKQLLAAIAKKMQDRLKEISVDSRILQPKHVMQIINQMFHKQNGEKYDNSKFIYEQLIPSMHNAISNDGILSIENVPHKVFYTKQYPNITNSDESSYLDKFIKIANDKNIDFCYCVNISLKPIDFDSKKIYEFNTTLVIKDHTSDDELENYIQSYFRYELGWFIYRNQLSPFQQFFDCIPFQFDNSSVERLTGASITQRLPINKLVQLFPMESKDEN